MKLIVLLLSVFALVSCSSDYTPKDKTNSYVIPETLKDCNISELSGSLENDIIVVRCPLSTTSTTWTERSGKVNRTYTVVTIDGKEYQKVDKTAKTIKVDGEDYVEIK